MDFIKTVFEPVEFPAWVLVGTEAKAGKTFTTAADVRHISAARPIREADFPPAALRMKVLLAHGAFVSLSKSGLKPALFELFV